MSTELTTDLRSAAGEPAESHQLVPFDVFYHELVITSVIIIKKGSKRLSALGVAFAFHQRGAGMAGRANEAWPAVSADRSGHKDVFITTRMKGKY